MSAHVIEAMLLRWGESPTGRTVTFLLPEDPGPHPFKGLPTGPAHGQRLALSVVLISDDESQTPHEPAVVRSDRTTQPPLQAPAEPAERQNGNEADKHRLSRQAAMCCQDARFWKFLWEELGVTITGPDNAADYVRGYCIVNSRAALDTDSSAAARWRELHGRYVAWLHAPEVR